MHVELEIRVLQTIIIETYKNCLINRVSGIIGKSNIWQFVQIMLLVGF